MRRDTDWRLSSPRVSARTRRAEKTIAQARFRCYTFHPKTVSASIFQQRSAEALAFYSSERKLVRHLSKLVLSPRGPVRCREVAFEFDYAAGRTDLVGLGPQSLLHAFETKLSKWRKALDQARRNICFAHYSYVVLPARTAENALKAEDEFRRHGVGLVALDGKHGKLTIPARRNAPLLPWLTQSALGFVLGK